MVFDINQTRAILAATSWERRREVAVQESHRVYTHDCLPLGHFYVDHDRELIVMGLDTFQALALSPPTFMAVVSRFITSESGLLFLNMHEGQFGDLLRARAAEAGVDTVVPHDTVHALQVRTQWLVVKAQSLRKAAAPGELEIFLAERAQLSTECAHIAEGVRRLEAMLDFATDLVYVA